MADEITLLLSVEVSPELKQSLERLKEAIQQSADRIRFLENRQQELLLANNIEVERRRDLTRRMREASELVGGLYDLGDIRTEGDSPVTNMDPGTYRACQVAAKIEKLLEV